jgi:hypothetical protein
VGPSSRNACDFGGNIAALSEVDECFAAQFLDTHIPLFGCRIDADNTQTLN